MRQTKLVEALLDARRSNARQIQRPNRFPAPLEENDMNGRHLHTLRLIVNSEFESFRGHP
jgi:hypothetical protein